VRVCVHIVRVLRIPGLAHLNKALRVSCCLTASRLQSRGVRLKHCTIAVCFEACWLGLSTACGAYDVDSGCSREQARCRACSARLAAAPARLVGQFVVSLQHREQQRWLMVEVVAPKRERPVGKLGCADSRLHIQA
jgi:hypothetical protein